jgi:hypothetical protein
MKTIKRGGLIGISLVLAIMLIGIVSASGVGYPGNPVEMLRGETKTVSLNIQSLPSEGDLTYKVTLTGGLDIVAPLTQDTYLVKAGTSNTYVPVVITIPEDASIGQKTTVSLKFSTVAGTSAGTGTVVTLGTGMSVKFDVIVVEKGGAKPLPITWIIVGIVVLILLIWLISASRKKRKK